ncbi:MAG: hypothetical protein Q8P18_28395 [Pseudomonadota bacterium]|nr:hypothetical protein [Pseudomonadota bacterium]
MSVELGPLSRIAAFSVAAAGFIGLVAAGQESAMVIFRDAFTGALPLVFMAAGVVGIAMGWKLAHPRAWARPVAAFALVLLGCAGAPWSVWLMVNGLFTALSILAPPFAILALVLLGVAWRDIGRTAALRAVAEAETASLLAQAQKEILAAGGDPGPPERPWLLPFVYGVVSVPIALFAVAVFAPETWSWGEVRASGILAGRNPFASSFVAHATAYPYEGSPLAWYLDYEDRWVDLEKEDVLAVADSIAEDVAWRLVAATDIADPVEAERALWASGRQEELPLWIAGALRERNVYYSLESLFSRSFNPDVHVLPDSVHLDCDQLAYIFLHVAWRLDLAMAAVPSPMHVYLRYGGPDGQAPLWIEATRFRHVDIDGTRVDYMGKGIGESFFIDGEYYPSGRGGSWASGDVVDAAGLYQPWTERDIRDSVVANVMVGLERHGIEAPYAGELEAHLAGSREITLVSNLYGHYINTALAAMKDGKRDDARAAAQRAQAIRASHGALVIYVDRQEERMLLELEVQDDLGGEGLE